MDEALCRRLFQQLMVAVDYCHRLGIANRDVKVCNRPRHCTTCKECMTVGAREPLRP